MLCVLCFRWVTDCFYSTPDTPRAPRNWYDTVIRKWWRLIDPWLRLWTGAQNSQLKWHQQSLEFLMRQIHVTCDSRFVKSCFLIILVFFQVSFKCNLFHEDLLSTRITFWAYWYHLIQHSTNSRCFFFKFECMCAALSS